MNNGAASGLRGRRRGALLPADRTVGRAPRIYNLDTTFCMPAVLMEMLLYS